MKYLFSLCTVAASLLIGPLAFAQAPAVSSSLTAQRVDMVEGKAVLKPLTEAKPGDVIEYAGTYRNAGKSAVDKLQATVPVPVGTTYIASSAVPAAAMASTDGSRFEAMPLMRTVRQANGVERSVPVPLADYRALRWDIGALAPSGANVVSLRVRVDAPAPPAAAASVPAARP